MSQAGGCCLLLQGMCTSEIVCAGETAAGGGVLDYRGIVGFACSCGIPIRKLYMVMPTPEQFAYDSLDLHMLGQGRTLCVMGCDSSCKLEPHLRRLFPGTLVGCSPPLPDSPGVHACAASLVLAQCPSTGCPTQPSFLSLHRLPWRSG
jgi:hypothetical protein